MTYFLMAVGCYLAAGSLFAFACLPRFVRDASIIRGRGELPHVGGAVAKAVLAWPRYLFARGDRGRWRPGAARPVWFYRRPDRDRIEQLERDIYGGES